MPRGAGEPSAKRAKADDAKDEEKVVCFRLPPELWEKIVDEYLDQNDLLALAMTCTFFRDTTKGLGKKLETNLNPNRLFELRKSGRIASHTLGWFQWICDTLTVLPGFEGRSWVRVKGAVYEGVLLNYAAFQGSVEILKWLMEKKGWGLNQDTDRCAGMGGSIKVLEYLKAEGYKFYESACQGAASGGHLKALKFLRGLDPPCPWDEETCSRAAREGHLDVLKWARAQDPPCPWSAWTCVEAAEGGRLDVLKWARSQNPPCPWVAETCDAAAQGGHLDVLKWARSQNPPCPWGEFTCKFAAEEGQLEALKFLRSQNPPCPWSRGECRDDASDNGHQHVVDWMDEHEE
ncbi:putative ankyrin repeat protein [Chloropicon roscoffensis]|uniref:Ankyrin repeat protein n=1 Tax=Chloropicon roscoffensis TaxID=1461544 RepID=A0AAX4PKG3_9CHLO